MKTKKLSEWKKIWKAGSKKVDEVSLMDWVHSLWLEGLVKRVSLYDSDGRVNE